MARRPQFRRPIGQDSCDETLYERSYRSFKACAGPGLFDHRVGGLEAQINGGRFVQHVVEADREKNADKAPSTVIRSGSMR